MPLLVFPRELLFNIAVYLLVKSGAQRELRAERKRSCFLMTITNLPKVNKRICAF